MSSSPIACESCRRCHRKCERSLPACQYCKLKGKKCTYPDPTTTGRVRVVKTNKQIVFRDLTQKYASRALMKVDGKENTISTKSRESTVAIMVAPSSMETRLGRTGTVNTHFDVCFEDMKFFLPVIESAKMRTIMIYIRDQMCKIPEEVTPLPGSLTELALVFSIQTTSCMRSGWKEVAKILYEKTREVLLPVFEYVETDIQVAACYACLCQYLMSAGEPERASFYLNNGLKYFEKNPPPLSYSQRVVHNSLSGCSQLLRFSDDIAEKFRQTDKTVDTNHNETLDFRSEDIVLETIRKLFDVLDLRMNIPTYDTESKKLYFMTLFWGLQLQNIKARGESFPDDDEKCSELANKIVESTTSDLYPICHPLIVIALTEATNIHMKMLEDSPSQDLINKVRTGLNGLKIMSERHGIVRLKYAPYISHMEDLVRIHDQVVESVSPMYLLYKQPSSF